MLIEYLSSYNLNKFRDYLDIDVTDSIGREFYRGVVVTVAGSPKAAMVWELIDLYDELKPTRSRIDWIKASDYESGKYLLKMYRVIIADDEVEESFFEFEEGIEAKYIDLLRTAGFKESESEGRFYRISVSDLKDMKHIGSLRAPLSIKSLEMLESIRLKKSLDDCVENTNRYIIPDIRILPISWFDQLISCYDEQDDECLGLFLFHKTPSGILRVELLSDWGSDVTNSLMYMIKYSAGKALENYSDDTTIMIIDNDSKAKKLVSYLFPQAEVSMCIRGVRKEYKDYKE